MKAANKTARMSPEVTTLGRLFLHSCRTHRKPDRMLVKKDGAWQAISTEDDRDLRPAALPGLPGPRPEAGRPGRPSLPEQAGVGHGRFRRPLGRRRDGPHLHLAPPGPGPLHRRQLRGEDRRLRGPGPVEKARGRAERPALGRERRPPRRGGPRRDADPRRRPGEGKAARGQGARDVRALGRGRPARRSGLHHLHFGDDRPAEGRDAQPREFHRQHQVPDGGHRFPERRYGPLVPPVIPRPRADGLVHLRPQGIDDRLRRERRGRRRESPRGPADHRHQRAPALRKDLRPGHGPGPGRVPPQEGGLRLGPGDGEEVRGQGHRRGAGAESAGLQAGPGPEARLCEDHLPDGRPDAGSSSAAARPSPRTSSSSSAPWGSSSCRDTG